MHFLQGLQYVVVETKIRKPDRVDNLHKSNIILSVRIIFLMVHGLSSGSSICCVVTKTEKPDRIDNLHKSIIILSVRIIFLMVHALSSGSSICRLCALQITIKEQKASITTKEQKASKVRC